MSGPDVAKVTLPIAAILHCPGCAARHFDEGEWRERPHRRHQCEHCRFRWIIEPPCFGAHDCDWPCCMAIAVRVRKASTAIGLTRDVCAYHEAKGERLGYWLPLEGGAP